MIEIEARCTPHGYGKLNKKMKGNAMIAHITETSAGTVAQSIKEHSSATAGYASESLKTAGLYATGYLCGILHDMGKAKQEFQDYILDGGAERGTVIHSFAGAIYILDRYHTPGQRYAEYASEIIAYAILSHHGIIDICQADRNGLERIINYDREKIHYEESKTNFFNEVTTEADIDRLFGQSVNEIQTAITKFADMFPKEKYGAIRAQAGNFCINMTARLVLSALVDGDCRDTAEFEMQEKFAKQDTCWAEDLENLEHHLAEISSHDTDLGVAKQYISDSCLRAAGYGKGIYMLSVPTGGGKTFASLRYALAHAEKHGMDRILFIIPRLNILKQNRSEMRNAINDDILEYDSDVINICGTDGFSKYAETWDAPIITSTMVQLLNVLFSSKKSCIRRMRALCNSVIVIDEVQMVPKKTLFLFNMAINFLKAIGSTVVLSSATQPVFEKMRFPLAGPVKDLVERDDALWQAFIRNHIVNSTCSEITEEDLMSKITGLAENKRSVLAVCNTRAEARKLFEMLKSNNRAGHLLYCMTNNMCPAHKENVLESLRTALSGSMGQSPCRHVICISTSLVEAGMDISFEHVIRYLAGLDHVIQTAGRNNRYGEFDSGKCMTEVVKVSNDSPFGETIDEQASFVSNFRNIRQIDLSEQNISTYFTDLISRMQQDRTLEYDIPDMTGVTMMSLFSTQRFPNSGTYSLMSGCMLSGGTKFQAINSTGYSVIIPYDREACMLIDRIKSIPAKFSREWLKAINDAKPYTVQIHEKQYMKLRADNMLCSVADDAGNEIIWLNSMDAYDSDTGI